ncbi:hypothetical protein SAMN05443248_6903 [Bradyrhizobium erythrophlei]|uniref:Uncharacterized protein n=1 Tax=Bradyrhizobium erythrophlei TaxID=1437360 RepID=A0A1M5X163_9BRAD|nr:hypothetical protein SAMN05443248_6903 [Bradyrhizobium erythrophlei]
MNIGVESVERAPTLTLPRKRERGPTGIAARESIANGLSSITNGLSMRQDLLPLPLAGEGRGGGLSAGTRFEAKHNAAGAAS